MKQVYSILSEQSPYQSIQNSLSFFEEQQKSLDQGSESSETKIMLIETYKRNRKIPLNNNIMIVKVIGQQQYIVTSQIYQNGQIPNNLYYNEQTVKQTEMNVLRPVNFSADFQQNLLNKKETQEYQLLIYHDILQSEINQQDDSFVTYLQSLIYQIQIYDMQGKLKEDKTINFINLKEADTIKLENIEVQYYFNFYKQLQQMLKQYQDLDQIYVQNQNDKTKKSTDMQIMDLVQLLSKNQVEADIAREKEKQLNILLKQLNKLLD